jgi:hypothetical protein
MKRWNQLDVTLKRTFKAGRYEFLPAIEVFNLANSSVVLNQIQTFGGSNYGNPTQIMQGRFVKLSAMIKF